MARVSLTLLQQDYGFEATEEQSGIKVRYDNALSGGGKEFGISPMHGLLMSLGSCCGVDVVLILKKKKQAIDYLAIEVEGMREENKFPSPWQKAHITFILEGNIDEAKAIRSIEMSVNIYCSVAETLRRAGCTITWELKLNK